MSRPRRAMPWLSHPDAHLEARQPPRDSIAARVVLAAPVCAPDVERTLGDVADEMVCLMAPKRFFAAGQFYADFRPTSEAEVVELLRAGPGPYSVH